MKPLIFASALVFSLPVLGFGQASLQSKLQPATSTLRHDLAVELVRMVSSDLPSIRSQSTDSGGPSDTPLTRAIGRLATAHFEKYVPRDTLLAIMVLEYEREYGESELRDLIAYRQSPLGIRAAATQRKNMNFVTAEITRRLREHQAELDAAVKEVMVNAVAGILPP